MPGESGGRNVTLHLGAPDASQPPGALLVMVGNVSNADLSVEQSSTVISDIPAANFTTGFTINPNQVGLSWQPPILLQACRVPRAAQRTPSSLSHLCMVLVNVRTPFQELHTTPTGRHPHALGTLAENMYLYLFPRWHILAMQSPSQSASRTRCSVPRQPCATPLHPPLGRTPQSTSQKTLWRACWHGTRMWAAP